MKKKEKKSPERALKARNSILSRQAQNASASADAACSNPNETAERRRSAKIRNLILAAAVLLFCLLYYIFNIEPFMLRTDRVVLNTSGPANAEEILQGEAPLRIVQFSDTHFKQDFPVENMERIAKEINALKPDIVLFTGDLYDDYSAYHNDERLIEFLNMIQAPYGKLAIWGNRDYGGGAEKSYLHILDESGFTLLQNSNWYIPITLPDGREKTILFTGLDDAMFGNPAIPQQTKIYPSDYNILIIHEPDGYEAYAGQEYNITMSGHTHGRQTGIPSFLWPDLETKSVYWKGLYEEDGALLSVNSGIGTTHISARFLMPPSLTLYEIYL